MLVDWKTNRRYLFCPGSDTHKLQAMLEAALSCY